MKQLATYLFLILAAVTLRAAPYQLWMDPLTGNLVDNRGKVQTNVTLNGNTTVPAGGNLTIAANGTMSFSPYAIVTGLTANGSVLAPVVSPAFSGNVNLTKATVAFPPFGVTGLSTIEISNIAPPSNFGPGNLSWTLKGAVQLFKANPDFGVKDNWNFANGLPFPNTGRSNVTVTNGSVFNGTLNFQPGLYNGTFTGLASEWDVYSNTTFKIPYFQNQANITTSATGTNVTTFVGFQMGNTGIRFGTEYDATNGTLVLFCNSTAHTSDTLFTVYNGTPIANSSVAAVTASTPAGKPTGVIGAWPTGAILHTMVAGPWMSCWFEPTPGKQQPLGGGVTLFYWANIDPQSPQALANITPCWWGTVPAAASGNTVISGLEDGYAGPMAINNINFIKTEDGDPISIGGWQRVVATGQFPSSDPFAPYANSEMVVFKFNEDSHQLVQTAALADLRNGSYYSLSNYDVLGDGDGQDNYDRRSGPIGPNGTPIPINSMVFTNQNDELQGYSGNLGVFQATTTEDITNGIHIFTNVTLQNFPLLGGANATSLSYPGDEKYIGGNYDEVITEGFSGNSTTYTSLWTSPFANMTSPTLVGRNTAISGGQGPQLVKFGTTWYITQENTVVPTQVYALNINSTLTTNTIWTVNYPTGSNFTGFFAITTIERNGVTSFVAVSNATDYSIGEVGTQGTVLIYECPITMTGDQYPENIYPLLK